jgi:hypothetical protein
VTSVKRSASDIAAFAEAPVEEDAVLDLVLALLRSARLFSASFLVRHSFWV